MVSGDELIQQCIVLSCCSDLQSITQDKNEINIRNNIIDRNGIILASTLPTASAYIYPKHFTNSIQSLKYISNQTLKKKS